MSEIITPYDFTLAMYEGILRSELKDDYSFEDGVMKIVVSHPMRIQFTGTNPLFNSDDFNGFMDWSQSSECYRSHSCDEGHYSNIRCTKAYLF